MANAVTRPPRPETHLWNGGKQSAAGAAGPCGAQRPSRRSRMRHGCTLRANVLYFLMQWVSGRALCVSQRPICALLHARRRNESVVPSQQLCHSVSLGAACMPRSAAARRRLAAEECCRTEVVVLVQWHFRLSLADDTHAHILTRAAKAGPVMETFLCRWSDTSRTSLHLKF